MPKVNQNQRGRFAQKKVLEKKVLDALRKSTNGKRQLAATRIYENVLPLTSQEKRRKVKISLSDRKSSFSISCGDLETMKVETVLYHIRNWANIDSGTFQTILSCDDKRLGDTYYVRQCVGLRELLQKKKNLKCTIVPRQMYISLPGTSESSSSESSSEEEENGSDTDVVYETSDDDGCWV